MDKRLGTLGIDRDAVFGIVVVWSGSSPAYATHRLGGGLTFEHLQIVADQKGLNIRGAHGHDNSPSESMGLGYLPFVTHTGRSVLVVVGDVRPFERVTPTRHGKLVVAASLAATLEKVDAAARAEDHVAIHGPRVVGAELAKRYASLVGSEVWFRPSGDQHLDHLLAMRDTARVVVIDLVRPLFDHDVRAIERLLETDLRFVVLTSDDHYTELLPRALAPPQLARVAIPGRRFDELPTTIYDRVTKSMPDAAIKPSAIAELLDRRMGEDRLMSTLEAAIAHWAAAGYRELDHIEVDHWFSRFE